MDTIFPFGAMDELFLFNSCVYVCVCVPHVCRNPSRPEKKVLGSLELELQWVVSCLLWVLGTDLRSSARTV